MGRNWNFLAKLGLCIFGRPYKIPGAEPEEKSEVRVFCSSEHIIDRKKYVLA